MFETKRCNQKLLEKRKYQDDINQSIFQRKTTKDFAVAKSIVSTFNVRIASINVKADKRNASISINTLLQDLETLASFSQVPVTLDIEISEKTSGAENTPISSVGGDYVHLCLQKSFPGLLKYQAYEEVSESALGILNQDWKNKAYVRIACGQLLAGSILVEGSEALLINCIELYNRKPSFDPHYERSGSRYMISNGPSMDNKYSNLNIISKVEDRSKKLLIGTLVFNGLVTPSIRLDQARLSEVDASAFLFSKE